MSHWHDDEPGCTCDEWDDGNPALIEAMRQGHRDAMRQLHGDCPHCGGAPRAVYGTSLIACAGCGRYIGQQVRP